MGFGESMTQGIFFIASTVIALAIVGVATLAVGSMTNSFNGRTTQLSAEIKTGIKISGDSCFLGGSNYVYVKNTGGSTLDPTLTDIFVDSSVYSASAVDIYNGTSWVPYLDSQVWRPGDLARFTTANILPSGYHKIRVVTQYGVYDSLDYMDC